MFVALLVVLMLALATVAVASCWTTGSTQATGRRTAPTQALFLTREQRPGSAWTLVRVIGRVDNSAMTANDNNLLPVIGPFKRMPKSCSSITAS